MKTLKYLPLVVLVVIIVVLMKGLKLHPNMIPSPLINKKVPEFSLPTLFEPKKIITNRDLLNKITLLNVWASGCYTCANEHEFLLELAKNKNITLYGFNYKDDSKNAIQWLQDYGNPYQIIVVDHDGQVAIDWGVYGTPETFLIDKNGIIRYKVIGALNKDIWQKELLPLIEKIQKEERS